MLKNRRLAYDGKGNAVVLNEEKLIDAVKKLIGPADIKSTSLDLYAEKWVPFKKELAVMVVRTSEGVLCYPVVETIQKDNVCHIVIAPAQIPESVSAAATEAALSAIASYNGLGIYGVELFMLQDDSILLNEIAPRPHNSGHYTMEACDIDQFEMHLRAVLGWPCPQPVMRVNCAVMINVLGEENMEQTLTLPKRCLTVPGASIHWYGKEESRKGRKMAHITVTAVDWRTLSSRLENLGIPQGEQGVVVPGPQVGIIMGSDSDLPTMKEAAEILDSFGVPYELTVVSAHRTPNRMYSYAQSAVERGLKVSFSYNRTASRRSKLYHRTIYKTNFLSDFNISSSCIIFAA